MGMNVFDRNAGFARGQEQVWGFDKSTGIDSKSYLAPGAKIFYVDPNNAQAVDFGNLGEDPTVPLATVAAAVALCRDHAGDTIVVGGNDAWQYAPGNRPLPIAEELVIPATKGGIRLVGASSNPLGVSWQATDDNQTLITINAIDVLIEGFTFDADTHANVTAISVLWNGVAGFGENLTVRGCAFVGALDYGIALDYSWYCQIYKNYFGGCLLGAIFNVVTVGDAGYNLIHDNDFEQNVFAIALPGAGHNHIYGNRIFGDPAGALNFIDLTDVGATGNLVSQNVLGCTLAQYAATCADSLDDAWVSNYCIDGPTVANP
jgi:hypothetical protein